MRRVIGPLLFLLPSILSCSSLADPGGVDAVFVLTSVRGKALPVATSSTFGGRVIEVTGGSLLFEGFARGRGTAHVIRDVRITDPGVAPLDERIEGVGAFVRQGESLRIQLGSGAWQQFVLEDEDAALRLETWGCAPDDRCVGALIEYRYERSLASPL